MATTTPSGTTSCNGGGGGSGGSSREGAAKVIVADQISQAVQSTSNLLHLMQQSSPSQGFSQLPIKKATELGHFYAQLIKLPKSLLSKSSTIKNTGQVLEQLPRVISSLDAHMDSGLQSVPHLKTVIQLLANMESCQLSSLSQPHPSQEEHDREDQHPVAS